MRHEDNTSPTLAGVHTSIGGVHPCSTIHPSRFAESVRTENGANVEHRSKGVRRTVSLPSYPTPLASVRATTLLGLNRLGATSEPSSKGGPSWLAESVSSRPRVTFASAPFPDTVVHPLPKSRADAGPSPSSPGTKTQPPPPILLVEGLSLIWLITLKRTTTQCHKSLRKIITASCASPILTPSMPIPRQDAPSFRVAVATLALFPNRFLLLPRTEMHFSLDPGSPHFFVNSFPSV